MECEHRWCDWWNIAQQGDYLFYHEKLPQGRVCNAEGCSMHQTRFWNEETKVWEENPPYEFKEIAHGTV